MGDSLQLAASQNQETEKHRACPMPPKGAVLHEIQAPALTLINHLLELFIQ